MIMDKNGTLLSFLKMEYKNENHMNPHLTAKELEEMDRKAKIHNKIVTINNTIVESIEKKVFDKKDQNQSLEETDIEKDL